MMVFERSSRRMHTFVQIIHMFIVPFIFGDSLGFSYICGDGGLFNRVV